MHRWSATAAITLALCGVWPARAQISPSANGPIDISADETEFVNDRCVSTWRGAAEALQGDSRLRANSITAYLKPKGPATNGQANCGETDRIEADGDVFYVTPTQLARGDHAVYSADAHQIVMTGNVIVVQGKNVVRGDRLTIDVTSHEAHMASSGGTRVRAVLFPDHQGSVPGLPAPAP